MPKKISIIWQIRVFIVLIAITSVAIPVFAGNLSQTVSGQPGAVVLKEQLDTQEHKYLGTLRLYVVEPTSRYSDLYGVPFSFGFLGFAYNQPISLGFTDTLSETVTWTGSGLSEGNVMVIATLFNEKEYQGYSNPDASDCPFTAHYVDATASAFPGHTGVDTASGSYTHTVFVEEVTAPG